MHAVPSGIGSQRRRRAAIVPALTLPAAAGLPVSRYRPDCYLEFPRGGSQAMVDALVRGVEKHGGRLLLRSHVEQILVEGGKATGGPGRR